MTSELSNALNPYIARSRPRNVYPSPLTAVHTPQLQHQITPSYVPHRSELEHAIIAPQSSSGTLDEILRVLNANKEEAEKEKQRRMAWEKEQEEKYASKQSELERQLLDMKEEIGMLKSSMTSAPTAPASIPDIHFPAPVTHPNLRIPVTTPAPLTPVSQHAYPPQPAFVEGSSSNLYEPQTPSATHPSSLLTPQISHMSSAGTSTYNTPSPVVMHAPSPMNAIPPAGPSTSRKRSAPPSQSSNDDSEDDSGLDDSGALPRKRLNGHDKRCLTIQHAIRAHFLRIMKIQSDRDLPASHPEGVPLSDDMPIRYIWEKTTKQSPHNAAMKSRFLSDIKAKHKRLYKYVPEKDFSAKTLENAYDQAYTTLRQKYKAQKDHNLAENIRIKEEQKALKSRRNFRKKTKLSSRTDARTRIDLFSHPTFDGAFQPECMSSEESCDESPEPTTPSGPNASVQVLRIRGLPWRSSRLLRLYMHLDEDEKVDRSLKAKRIQTRTKERCLGPPKDGFHLPPKGIATWMVSQRWVRETRDAHPDLGELLKDLMVEPPGFDWQQFDLLGMDSEEEQENEQEEIPRSEISYSLAHALAPM
ncbi:hypothetical protein EUX98_g6906 [Antrodiella citrinella]|uniref:Uncharacterized protein n=1 Tax=Antrodiella citrinella TaxID=2447956 RepID=A0A4S4MMV2_9APHY|nr:hypothetical protein EUX98_g6906 [Antrodiella citrinella]